MGLLSGIAHYSYTRKVSNMDADNFNKRKYELRDEIEKSENKILDLGSPDKEVFKILIHNEMPFYDQITQLIHALVIYTVGEGLLTERKISIPHTGMFRMLSINMPFAVVVRAWEISMLTSIGYRPKGYFFHFIDDKTRHYSDESSINISAYIEGATSAIVRVSWESMLPLVEKKYGSKGRWFDLWPENVQLLRHIRNAVSHDWMFNISSNNDLYRQKEYSWEHGINNLQFEDKNGDAVDIGKHVFTKFYFTDILALITTVWDDMN